MSRGGVRQIKGDRNREGSSHQTSDFRHLPSDFCFDAVPSYLELLLLVLPVFALIGVGVAVRRVHWIEGEAETSLIRLAVNVCYPCLIFESIAGNAALRSPGNLLLPPLVGFCFTWFAIQAGLLVAHWIGLHVGSGLRTFALAVGIAKAFVDQQHAELPSKLERGPSVEKKVKNKDVAPTTARVLSS